MSVAPIFLSHGSQFYAPQTIEIYHYGYVVGGRRINKIVTNSIESNMSLTDVAYKHNYKSGNCIW